VQNPLPYTPKPKILNLKTLNPKLFLRSCMSIRLWMHPGKY
jgi:hypothetical protein